MARTRILVVDDDPDILQTMQDLLAYTFHDAEVRTAPDGERALQVLADNGWAAVVTDYRMPGMDGAQLARKVNQAKPGVPILLITAYDDAAIDQAARQSGVRAILRKPFDVDQFVEAVSRLLRP